MVRGLVQQNCIVSCGDGVGGCNYTHHWHIASVAMAQFTIVPRSLATQVKTFAYTAKLYDLTSNDPKRGLISHV